MRLTRRTLLGAAAAGGLALLAPGVATARRAGATAAGASATANVMVRWNEALLQGVRESKLGPPMVARALAVAHTCAYDAWAAYDGFAVGTRLGGTLRRPARERRFENKVEAVSHATYRAAVDLFPGSKAGVFDPLMAGLGLDPADDSREASAPAGVGNLVADAVLAFRHRDGANQLGDEVGGRPGVPYSDYTGYTPANEAMDTQSPLDPATVHDVNRWQPLTYLDGSGTLVTPSFAGAQWQHVRPFARASGDQLRSPTGPARYGSPVFVAQALELLDLSAGLTDEQKVIAEYWADGPRSELPPGHWNLFAQQILLRDRSGSSERELDRAVKLFFALTNAIFDSGCCAWENKVAFDSVRPITAIRWLFRGTSVTAWGGPGRGTQRIAGRTGSPTSRRASRHRRSPSTRRATATSAPPEPRSSGCSPAATASADRSRSPAAAPAWSRDSSRLGTRRSRGRPSPTPRHRRGSRAATAASTSCRATSTLARPAGPRRGAAGTSPAPTSQGPLGALA